MTSWFYCDITFHEYLPQDICTHAHVMSEHSSWDGEKTVIITCRYIQDQKQF